MLVTVIIGQSVSCVSYWDNWGREIAVLFTGIIGAKLAVLVTGIMEAEQ